MPSNRKTEPAKSKSPARPPSVRGEKRVSKTDQAVPVAPPPREPGTHDGPTDPAAIDRRSEITGTDALPESARAKGGGNPGRSATGLPGRV